MQVCVIKQIIFKVKYVNMKSISKYGSRIPLMIWLVCDKIYTPKRSMNERHRIGNCPKKSYTNMQVKYE